MFLRIPTGAVNGGAELELDRGVEGERLVQGEADEQR